MKATNISRAIPVGINYLRRYSVSYLIENLRELIVAMEEHYHLGIAKSVTRGNLSKVNEQRNYRIFEEYVTFVIAEARKRRINKILELDGHVYAFDSTTIDLCL